MQENECILDTNILLRFLLKDDLNKAFAVKSLLSQDRSYYIYDVVIAEIMWVLLKVYKFEKIEILNRIKNLLALQNIFYSKLRIQEAFDIWEVNDISYVDAYLLAGSIIDKRAPLYTFDDGIIKAKASENLAKKP